MISMRAQLFILTLLIVATSAVSWIWLCSDPANLDEPYHLAQIRLFLAGCWEMYRVEGATYPFLAMIPGYHAVTAGVCALIGCDQLNVVRTLSYLTSLLLLLAFYAAASKIDRTTPLSSNPKHERETEELSGVSRAESFDLVQQPSGHGAIVRTGQLYFLPILFPFFFLVYTETFSMLCVQLCLTMQLGARRWWAGFAGLCSLLVRQNLILMLGGILLIPTPAERWPSPPLSIQNVLQFVRRHVVPFLPAILFFTCFVLINGRVPLTHPRLQKTTLSSTSLIGWTLSAACIALAVRQDLHHEFSRRTIRRILQWATFAVCVGIGVYLLSLNFDVVHDVAYGLAVQICDAVMSVLEGTSASMGNILISLTMASVIFLPIQVRNIGRILSFAIRWPTVTLIVCLLCIAASLFFDPPDPRNQHLNDFLRNHLLLFFVSSVACRLLLAGLCLWALFSLFATHWAHPGGILAVPLWGICLLPMFLIEPRYYIPVMCFYLMFRQQDESWLEWLQLGYSILLAMIVQYFHAFTPFFL